MFLLLDLGSDGLNASGSRNIIIACHIMKRSSTLPFLLLLFLAASSAKLSDEKVLKQKLANCHTALPHLPPPLPAPGSAPFIRKTATSSTFRVVFIMGLEGTGHHAWSNIYNTCIRTGVGPCASNETLTTLLYKGGPLPEGIFAYGASPSDSPALVACRQRLFLSALAELKEKASSELIFLNGAEVKEGHLSFPSYNGPHKALHQPDVVALARLCESVGVDLRLVVMLRDTDAITASTVKRAFGKDSAHEVAVLTNNAAVMTAQLSLLDPAFTSCVQYDDMGDPHKADVRESLASFLHPKLTGDILKMGFRAKFHRAPSRAGVQDSSRERLDGLLQLLQHTCSATTRDLTASDPRASPVV